MKELIDLIVSKTGLQKDMAEKVVKIVVQFLKDKLPDQFDALVDKALASGGSGKMDVADAAKMLGGFFNAAKK